MIINDNSLTWSVGLKTINRIELYGYTGDNRIHNENEILYIRIPINKYMYIVYVFVQNKKFTKHTW